MTRPLSAGPTIAPVWKASEFILKALGKSRAGTKLGTNDWRAGVSKMNRRIVWEAVGLVWRLRLLSLFGRVE